MAKLFKCACNYICEGDSAPDVCPRCGAPKTAFTELSEEKANLIYKSDESNSLHMALVDLAEQIIDISERGIEINLDPGCLAVFTKAKHMAWTMKQFAKAEIETHIGKSKW